MTVPLPPHHARFARALVASGRYASEAEVVAEALRLLELQEASAVRDLLDDGRASGPPVPFDAEALRERLRARAEQLRDSGA